jgi:hypothetical protein
MHKAILSGCIAILLVLPGVALAHGHGHVMGTIRAVHSDHLDVQTNDGKSVSIPLAKATRYFRGSARATAAGLKAGARVVVHLAADGSAAEIRLPAATAAARHR